jgi:assimilatory nitrate reductase catalytic subunit
MGGREVGGLANLLSAHRDLSNPAHRAEVAALWGVPSVPAERGRSAVEMFEAAADGAIKALWIVCTNPAQSMPDQSAVRRALERCDFVVLQDAYAHTATAAYADLLLPATTWGEKDGTVTNSERCISRVRPAVAAVGEARDDWAIGVAVARRLEQRLKPARVAGLQGETMFGYSAPEEVWNEHRDSTRGRDLDITGLSYALLDQPRQWPHPAGAGSDELSRSTAGETASSPDEAFTHREPVRLYTDGRFATDDGRARFTAPAWRDVVEPRDARYPVSLTTGRLRDQWHGMSRTGTLGRLFAHAAEPVIEMHPQELARRRWAAGDLVRVSSRRGKLVLPVQPSESVAVAQAFVAMHWGGEVVRGEGVNALTVPAFCPQSHKPELKHAAVRIESAALPWQIAAAAWLPADRALEVREGLAALFPRFEFASSVPFGREPNERLGVRFRAACQEPVDAALVAEIESALGLADAPVLRYVDHRSGQNRTMALRQDGSLAAFMLAGDIAADAWVFDLLQQGAPAATFGRSLLAANARPPQPVPLRSPQVCACHDVSESRIVESLALIDGNQADRLRVLQQQLRCGTECGSCVPALRALVHGHPAAAAISGTHT